MYGRCCTPVRIQNRGSTSPPCAARIARLARPRHASFRWSTIHLVPVLITMGSADEAGTVRRSTRQRGGQSTYQPSLLSLGFGHARVKRPAAQHATAAPAKRPRSAPRSNGRGTTTDTSELVPVTREAFLRQYSVEGIADVFYQADWVDAETAQRWHDQLARLDEWYRPRLKVYGREIEQSRRIAGEDSAAVPACTADTTALAQPMRRCLAWSSNTVGTRCRCMRPFPPCSRTLLPVCRQKTAWAPASSSTTPC